MEQLSVTLFLKSGLADPILGDTLFGQLCWAIRNRYGNERLESILEGYTSGSPFAVVSDALPEGYLPLPVMPLGWSTLAPGVELKELKKRRWVHVDKAAATPVREWIHHATANFDGIRKDRVHPQPHNSINRATGTTGVGDFAPYTQPVLWKDPAQRLTVIALHDPERISEDELVQVIRDVGQTGYGRDASIGMGKFDLGDVSQSGFPDQDQSNSSLTLAPCAPQGLGFDSSTSFYNPFTRFGRHGDAAVHLGHPFKAPILLAEKGALFSDGEGFQWGGQGFIGQGLGGGGKISHAISETVHQGYAPVVRVRLERDKER